MTEFPIRRATFLAAFVIPTLSEELGYPSMDEDVRDRLTTILDSNQHALFVLCALYDS